ncbi:hypothetical protein BgiBS90_036681, partial [Biomphalaria glabrata]
MAIRSHLLIEVLRDRSTCEQSADVQMLWKKSPQSCGHTLVASLVIWRPDGVDFGSSSIATNFT